MAAQRSSFQVARDIFEGPMGKTFWDSPYFVRLRNGLMTLEEFKRTQEPFYHAVKTWSNSFLLLASRVDDLSVKRTLVGNVADEVALGGDDSDAHENTFLRFLRKLRSSEDSDVRTIPACASQVSWFIEMVRERCDTGDVRETTVFLATIEYVYAHLSQSLAGAITDQFGLENCGHYAVHQDLDVDHARELFSAADRLGDGDASTVVHEAIRVFAQLYDDMETLLYQNLVPFGNVYEDSGVELAFLPRQGQSVSNVAASFPPRCRVACVASGGCTALALARAGAHVDAIDRSRDQLTVVCAKATTPCSVRGVYERTFELVPFYVDRPGRLFNRRRLSYLFSEGAVGAATDEDFERIFTRAIAAQHNTLPQPPRPEHVRLRDLILYGKPHASAPLPLHTWDETFNLYEGDLADFLGANEGLYDLVSTSNITDWATDGYVTHLARSCFCALKPGGIVVCRTMHGRDPTSAFLSAGLTLRDTNFSDASGLYTVRVFTRDAHDK